MVVVVVVVADVKPPKKNGDSLEVWTKKHFILGLIQFLFCDVCFNLKLPAIGGSSENFRVLFLGFDRWEFRRKVLCKHLSSFALLAQRN